MTNKEKSSLQPINQINLFGYDRYFNFFINLFENDKLPNQLLFSGEKGIGKATFAYHLINYFFSKNEKFNYDIKNFLINKSNHSFSLINQSSHPNFYLIDLLNNKQAIDINQIRKMINYTNKTSFNHNIKFILIDNVEFLNISSVNSLLKSIEEPNNNTYFILIYNSHKKIITTLKSRCVEFKFHFSKNEKEKITSKLLKNLFVDIDENFFKEFLNYYNTPGFIINQYDYFLKSNFSDELLNLEAFVIGLLNSGISNYHREDFKLFSSLFEFSMYKKFLFSSNRAKIYDLHFNLINKINESQKYNLDIKNLFIKLKEEYTNAI